MILYTYHDLYMILPFAFETVTCYFIITSNLCNELFVAKCNMIIFTQQLRVWFFHTKLVYWCIAIISYYNIIFAPPPLGIFADNHFCKAFTNLNQVVCKIPLGCMVAISGPCSECVGVWFLHRKTSFIVPFRNYLFYLFLMLWQSYYDTNILKT